MTLILRMLGPFDLSPQVERCSRKGRWVLALLALRPGREVDRAWLAGTLWPDTPEPQALYDLRRELSRLRRTLGHESDRLRSVGTSALTLDLDGADVDVVAFDRAAALGDLEGAAALYRGPLLEGCTEPWALEEREARAQTYLRALEALAADDVARGDPTSAARRLRLAVKADPLRESAHRALMQALAAGGDHAAAAETFRALRLLLARELGAEPSVETRALYHALRAESRALVAPPAKAPPEARPRTAAGPTSQIPRPLTPLVGRAAEMDEILGRARASRLVTLTGSGGVGKSRLAVQVATVLSDDLADGAWFVELAPLADGALVVPAVASVLGVREAPDRPLVDLVAASLRDRQALLVLDNCEHVVDAAGQLAERLLHACADLTILATSRQPLGLVGEVAWRVPSLVPAEAMALFHERAGREDDPATVAQICLRLDGIPLAIELAAARTRALSAAQIAARLDDRFRLLTGGSRTALPRHRTLKAAVDWGYQLLTGDEQALLRRLSVFAGGSTLEAAEAVAGLDVLDPLAGLVDKSLVGFSGRYGLLETVRQYAGERLVEAGEADDTRARHLSYFVRLAEEAEPAIFGGNNDRTWIERLEAENDNLRAAFDFCQAGEQGAEPALRLAAALHWFWFARGQLHEGRDRMAAALRLRAAASPPVRARALAAAGFVAMWVGDYAGMAAPLGESLGLARELGDRRLAAYATSGLGAAATARGDTAAARPLFAETVSLARAEGDAKLLVFGLYWLGTAEHGERDLAAARGSLSEGLAHARRGGFAPGIGHTLLRLGEVAESEREPTRARSHYLESLQTLESAGDRWGIAMVLVALGRLSEQPERGARLLGAAEALSERTGGSVMPARPGAYEEAVAAARRALGEQAFARAWAEGRALDVDEAIAEARK